MRGQSDERHWYDRPLRIVQTVLRQPDAADYDAAAAIDYVQRLQGDVFIVNAGGLHAYYPSDVPGHHSVEGLSGDIVEAVCQRAREEGIRVLLRVDFRGGHRDMFLRHPDWFSYDADGAPLMMFGLHAATPISPYRNEGYGFPIVRELLQRYDVDGIWENAPSFGPLAYGPLVETAFRRDTGLELPRLADLGDPAYLAWQRWRYACVLQHTEAMRDLVKSYGQDKAYVPEAPAMLDVEWLRRSAQDIVEQGGAWDIITAPTFDVLRGSFGSPLQPVPVWRSEEITKYLKAARPDKTPVILFGPFDNQSRYTAVVGQELKLWLAGALAHGGAFWDCTFVGTRGKDFLDQRNQDVVAEYYGLLRQNEDVFLDARPVAEVAVVHSRTTEERFGSDDARKDGYVTHVRGIELALFENHICFDVLPQAHLSPDSLARYRTVVLPNTVVLSDEEVDVLRQYVEGGGGLVATYETSLRGEDEQLRQEYALADVFGVRSLGVRYGPMAYAYSLLRSRNELTAGLEETDICTNEGWIWFVAPTDGAEVPVTLVPEVVPQPPERGWVDTMETDLPVLVTHHHGRGRSAFFPGQTDRLFASSGHPDHGALLRNAICWTAGEGRQLVETDAPPGVHVSVTRQEAADRTMLHLLNYCGGYRRPITHTIPVTNVGVSVRLDSAPSRARLLRGGVDIPFEFEDGRVEITVPQVEVYEAVILEP